VKKEAEARKIERQDYRFTQRDARTFTGWTDFQVKTHLRELVDLEYILVHRGGRGQSFVYELLYDGQGQDGGKFMLALIDTGSLYDRNREHPGSTQVAPREHGRSITENPTSPNTDRHETQVDTETGESARPGDISQNRNRTGRKNVTDEGDDGLAATGT
jgi:hypothetical protein